MAQCKSTYKGCDVMVTVGFDSLPNGYFMTVESLAAGVNFPEADPDTGLIYSNLVDPMLAFPGVTHGVDHYANVLIGLRIPIDERFFDEVLAEGSTADAGHDQ